MLSNASTMQFASQRSLAMDANSLNQLHATAGQNSKGAIKETARQFEAVFMQELLKSMRQASMKSGLTENEASNLGSDMLDQQWAQQMTGMPGGIGAMIEKQLTQQLNGVKPGKLEAPTAANTPGVASTAAAKPVPGTTQQQANFVSQHNDAAEQVARETGIPASYMIGQAGHETGWGRAQIKNTDGSNAFNLFGIKAGPGWKGKVAEVTTTEYVNGVAQKVKARFRAYGSYAESFRDYASMLTGNPRYAKVMDNLQSAQSFASGLQKAGYATDPQYATKLSRAINAASSLQRAQA